MHLVTYTYHCCNGFESSEHADQDWGNTYYAIQRVIMVRNSLSQKALVVTGEWCLFVSEYLFPLEKVFDSEIIGRAYSPKGQTYARKFDMNKDFKLGGSVLSSSNDEALWFNWDKET